MILHTCAITGHRPAKLRLGREYSAASFRLRKKIYLQLVELYHKGVHRFLLGGALGVDLWAGELLLSMKEKMDFSDLEWALALPFEGYDKRWREQDRKRMEVIRAHSAEIVVVGDGVNPTRCYRLRNQYLVDHADCLLAVYDPSFSRSGTGMTLRYAEQKGLPLFVISPKEG